MRRQLSRLSTSFADPSPHGIADFAGAGCAAASRWRGSSRCRPAPERNLLLALTHAIVMFSIVAQGLTIHLRANADCREPDNPEH
jgi:hypothetical protein